MINKYLVKHISAILSDGKSNLIKIFCSVDVLKFLLLECFPKESVTDTLLPTKLLCSCVE